MVGILGAKTKEIIVCFPRYIPVALFFRRLRITSDKFRYFHIHALSGALRGCFFRLFSCLHVFNLSYRKLRVFSRAWHQLQEFLKMRLATYFPALVTGCNISRS